MIEFIFDMADAVVKTSVRVSTALAEEVIETPEKVVERSISLTETIVDEIEKALDKIF